MNIDRIGTEIPEEINIHKQIWGKNVEEVSYGGKGTEDQRGEDENRCAICNSRIDEFGYCACGGNLGVS
jgi:hypothetical protein